MRIIPFRYHAALLNTLAVRIACRIANANSRSTFFVTPAAARVHSLVLQLGLSRADAAALLREIAADLDRTPLDDDANLRADVERAAAALTAQGITVTTALQVRTLGAALVLGRQAKTLRNWRSSGVGPRWQSDHGVVLYDLVELLQWRSMSRTVPINPTAAVL